MKIFFNTCQFNTSLIVSFSILAFIVFPSANAASDDDLKNIFFRLYKGNNQTYYDVYHENAATLIGVLNLDDPTVVYIHGYTESTDSISVHAVVNAYMERSNHNVIAVDYRDIASQLNYIQVSMDAEPVGKAVAEALNVLVSFKLPAEKIHVVGHSMGAQVASHVGRNVSFTLERISGLDPAGPLFNFVFGSLSHSDAKFVDIIHTDMGVYGYGRVTEGADFFPNFGYRVQPGCPIFYTPSSPKDFCSHHRSWQYYAESILNPNAFLARKCSIRSRIMLFAGFRTGISSEIVPMGYATPSNARGHYCLITRPQSPYSPVKLRLTMGKKTLNNIVYQLLSIDTGAYSEHIFQFEGFWRGQLKVISIKTRLIRYLENG